MGWTNQEIAAATSFFLSLTALEELIIDSDCFPSSRLCDEQLGELHRSVLTALPSLLSRRSVSLPFCGITSRGMDSLSPILSRFLHLQSLDLTGSSVTNAAASSICAILCKRPALLVLCFLSLLLLFCKCPP